MAILDSKEKVRGEIYRITNSETQMSYIGQTLTHRKNRGSYRPFGTNGRFKDHVSEALCNTKRKQCWYLNSAIRKYGADRFVTEILETCESNEMDIREQHYISQFKSLYPTGYNLTAGGRTLHSISIEPDEQTSLPGRRGGCQYRSEGTRTLISTRLQASLESPSTRCKMSERTRQQHLDAKLEKYKGIPVDTCNIDEYIHQQSNRVVVILNKQKITFASKHSTPEERYTHARNFLQQIAESATLPN